MKNPAEDECYCYNKTLLRQAAGIGVAYFAFGGTGFGLLIWVFLPHIHDVSLLVLDLLLALVFAVVALSHLGGAVFCLAVAAKERILIKGDVVTWFRANGCSVEIDTWRIVEVREDMTSPPGRLYRLCCSVVTDDGRKLTFLEDLEGYEELVRYFRNKKAPAIERTFPFRDWPTFVALVMASLVFGIAALFVPRDLSQWVGCLVVFLFGGSVATRIALRNRNERIELTQSAIAYFDWRGRKRLDVPLDTLDPIMFSVTGKLGSRESVSCRLQTAQGALEWSPNFVGWVELMRYFQCRAKSGRE